MNSFVLDTGIIIGVLKNANYAKEADNKLEFTDSDNNPMISIINFAETYTIAKRNKWGTEKINLLNDYLRSIPIIYINNLTIAERYIEITLYCQGKHPDNPKGFTSISLSDNDRWIAATASILNATLITTDKDFEPLNGVFLNVEYFSPNKIKP